MYLFPHLVSSARLTQIFQIHKIASTGSVSLITYGLSVIGCLARIITALVEINDFKLLLSYVLAFTLNSYIVFCFFLFRSKGKSVEDKSKGKSVEDKSKEETKKVK